jgi:hypothetical protein
VSDVTVDRIGALESLLVETEAAHGVYETTELNGVYDEQWPRWYAGYAVDHGIVGVLGRAVAADELAAALTSAWDEFQRSDPRPTERWTTFIARRLAEQA